MRNGTQPVPHRGIALQPYIYALRIGTAVYCFEYYAFKTVDAFYRTLFLYFTAFRTVVKNARVTAHHHVPQYLRYFCRSYPVRSQAFRVYSIIVFIVVPHVSIRYCGSHTDTCTIFAFSTLRAICAESVTSRSVLFIKDSSLRLYCSGTQEIC